MFKSCQSRRSNRKLSGSKKEFYQLGQPRTPTPQRLILVHGLIGTHPSAKHPSCGPASKGKRIKVGKKDRLHLETLKTLNYLFMRLKPTYLDFCNISNYWVPAMGQIHTRYCYHGVIQTTITDSRTVPNLLVSHRPFRRTCYV